MECRVIVEMNLKLAKENPYVKCTLSSRNTACGKRARSHTPLYASWHSLFLSIFYIHRCHIIQVRDRDVKWYVSQSPLFCKTRILLAISFEDVSEEKKARNQWRCPFAKHSTWIAWGRVLLWHCYNLRGWYNLVSVVTYQYFTYARYSHRGLSQHLHGAFADTPHTFQPNHWIDFSVPVPEAYVLLFPSYYSFFSFLLIPLHILLRSFLFLLIFSYTTTKASWASSLQL